MQHRMIHNVITIGRDELPVWWSDDADAGATDAVITCVKERKWILGGGKKQSKISDKQKL